MRYRTISVEVGLDEFDDEDLVAHLKSKGYQVYGGNSEFDPSEISAGELGHIETLVVCGQTDVARAEALALVGRAIGRTLQ